MTFGTMKRSVFILSVLLLTALCASAKDNPRVFINPGHGGHDSNDRPTPFYLWTVGDTVTYYESASNLATGSALKRYLEEKGYEVGTTRVGNTSDDDLDLYEIVALAANSGADLFFAVHSNATGIPARLNYTLSLYRGYNGEPVVEGSDSIARAVKKHLQANQATVWTHPPKDWGDWSFYRNWGYKTGLGVLRYNKLPGMLCEGSFFDYVPERCRKLNTDFCHMEGWNQSLAIDEYFGRSGKGKTGVVAGLVRYQCERTDTTYKAFDKDLLQPANKLTVTLLNAKGRTVGQYRIDNLNNGFYWFEGLKPGRYRVRVEGADAESEVEVRANQSTYCNFEIAAARR